MLKGDFLLRIRVRSKKGERKDKDLTVKVIFSRHGGKKKNKHKLHSVKPKRKGRVK